MNFIVFFAASCTWSSKHLWNIKSCLISRVIDPDVLPPIFNYNWIKLVAGKLEWYCISLTFYLHCTHTSESPSLAGWLMLYIPLWLPAHSADTAGTAFIVCRCHLLTLHHFDRLPYSHSGGNDATRINHIRCCVDKLNIWWLVWLWVCLLVSNSFLYHSSSIHVDSSFLISMSHFSVVLQKTWSPTRPRWRSATRR